MISNVNRSPPKLRAFRSSDRRRGLSRRYIGCPRYIGLKARLVDLRRTAKSDNALTRLKYSTCRGDGWRFPVKATIGSTIAPATDSPARLLCASSFRCALYSYFSYQEPEEHYYVGSSVGDKIPVGYSVQPWEGEAVRGPAHRAFRWVVRGMGSPIPCGLWNV